MNKSDLITVLQVKESMTEKLAMAIVNLILDGFATELKNGGSIEIREFWSFVVS
jgi:nucleoid DNA-binding protein